MFSHHRISQHDGFLTLLQTIWATAPQSLTLFGLLIIELVVAVIGVYRSIDFFGNERTMRQLSKVTATSSANIRQLHRGTIDFLVAGLDANPGLTISNPATGGSIRLGGPRSRFQPGFGPPGGNQPPNLGFGGLPGFSPQGTSSIAFNSTMGRTLQAIRQNVSALAITNSQISLMLWDEDETAQLTKINFYIAAGSQLPVGSDVQIRIMDKNDVVLVSSLIVGSGDDENFEPFESELDLFLENPLDRTKLEEARIVFEIVYQEEDSIPDSEPNRKPEWSSILFAEAILVKGDDAMKMPILVMDFLFLDEDKPLVERQWSWSTN